MSEEPSSPDGLWRVLGFFILMVGFGLRLDTAWQGLATLLIVAGALAGTVGLGLLARRRAAFVAAEGKR